MVKRLLRAELKSLRDSIPEADRAASSAKLLELIRSLPEYKAARCVLLYYPIGSEPDFLPLAEAAATDGKGLAFPVVIGKDMAFCAVFSRLFFDELPAEVQDVPVDIIVSDGIGVLRFN